MDETVNKLLLASDKFLPDTHLKQPGFTYSTCGPFTKNKERIQKYKETGNTKYIQRNELDKACFQHDIAYKDFKDLARRTASDRILRGKAFNIAKTPKYYGYQRSLASMVYNFFNKKTSGAKMKFMPNQQFANELHKPMNKKIQKRGVYSSFKNNLWGADFADM